MFRNELSNGYLIKTIQKNNKFRSTILTLRLKLIKSVIKRILSSQCHSFCVELMPIVIAHKMSGSINIPTIGSLSEADGR